MDTNCPGSRSALLPRSPRPPSRRPRVVAVLTIAAFVLVVMLLPRRRTVPGPGGPATVSSPNPPEAAPAHGAVSRPPPRGPGGKSAVSAEEVVGRKVGQFARARLELAEKLAVSAKVTLQDDVRSFFAVVERGVWEEIDSAFAALAKRHDGDPRSPDLDAVWRAVLETYGAAEQAHLWPAQKLLDYGNGILGSLRPGMVYIGGTDAGCFIPTFLNETGDDGRHIVLTQNALADTMYLAYLRHLYGDQMQLPTETEAKKVIDDFFAEAWKRRQHDDMFPDEPKQVRPGEDIKMVDGKINVSGQPAVWDINEQILRALLERNPDLGFGYEESFPLTSLYAEAVPLGPITELRAPDAKEAFTAERAAETLEFWRGTTLELLSDPEASGSPEALKTWSHTLVAQANLLAGRDHPAEAEQAYRLATQLWSANPEAIGSLARLLDRAGRTAEAVRVLDDFVAGHPDQREGLEAAATWRHRKTGGPSAAPVP